MRPLTPSDVRWLIKRGLQLIPRSTLRDLGGAENKRQAALDAAADIVTARFDRHEVQGPDPIPAHGDVPGKSLDFGP